jgi:hypothetical protein
MIFLDEKRLSVGVFKVRIAVLVPPKWLEGILAFLTIKQEKSLSKDDNS